MDKSEFGSMKQMSSHQIQRTISTSIVLKGGRRRSMRKKGKRNLLPSNQAFLPLVSFQLLTLSLASNGGLLRSSLGPCFACRKFGHHQTKCHQRAVFQPTSLDVAKPKSSGWILAHVWIQISVFLIVLFSEISNVKPVFPLRGSQVSFLVQDPFGFQHCLLLCLCRILFLTVTHSRLKLFLLKLL